MGIEIERKFLLKNNDWKKAADQGQRIQQGYLNLDKVRTVRIRVIGEKGILTIKGKNAGTTRLEFEYEIPLEEAQQLLKLCHSPILEKTRYKVVHDKHLWEIDIFEGMNQGLEVAEVELQNENETVQIPDWIGQEVSGQAEYYNSSLIENPFRDW